MEHRKGYQVTSYDDQLARCIKTHIRHNTLVSVKLQYLALLTPDVPDITSFTISASSLTYTAHPSYIPSLP